MELAQNMKNLFEDWMKKSHTPLRPGKKIIGAPKMLNNFSASKFSIFTFLALH